MGDLSCRIRTYSRILVRFLASCGGATERPMLNWSTVGGCCRENVLVIGIAELSSNFVGDLVLYLSVSLLR